MNIINNMFVWFFQRKKKTSSSARSRVRGTLEVYHAFIQNQGPQATNTPSSINEQEWDIVNSSENNSDVESLSHNFVSGLE